MFAVLRQRASARVCLILFPYSKFARRVFRQRRRRPHRRHRPHRRRIGENPTDALALLFSRIDAIRIAVVCGVVRTRWIIREKKENKKKTAKQTKGKKNERGENSADRIDNRDKYPTASSSGKLYNLRPNDNVERGRKRERERELPNMRREVFAPKINRQIAPKWHSLLCRACVPRNCLLVPVRSFRRSFLLTFPLA